MPFPKAVDYHKPGKPRVPNGLGVVYVLASSVYLFILHFLDYGGALPLAGCVLFGGFLGLLDDWMDLRWKYKAVAPVFASLPLIALRQGETRMSTFIFGVVDFGIYYYLLVAPLIVTVTTNAVNMLAGLNGLETVCPLIILLGFTLISRERILLIVPVLVLVVLAYFNYLGKIFIGNVGSFSIGLTLAAFAIVSNIELTLLVAILPYIFNSSIILLNYFFFGRKPRIELVGDKLHSSHRRSLVTIVAYGKKLREHQIVNRIILLFIISTAISVLIHFR